MVGLLGLEGSNTGERRPPRIFRISGENSKVESRPGLSQQTLPSRLCRVLAEWLLLEGGGGPWDDSGCRHADALFQICYLCESEGNHQTVRGMTRRAGCLGFWVAALDLRFREGCCHAGANLPRIHGQREMCLVRTSSMLSIKPKSARI